MTYAGNFHRLVLIGDGFGEEWNTSLSIAHDSAGIVPPPDAALLAAVAGAVGTWFAGTSTTNAPRICNAFRLTSIKLNRIGPDGRYTEPTTLEHIYPTPIAGGGSFSTIPQAATVMSLWTDVARGPAARGRMYWPCAAGWEAPDSLTGQVVLSNATRFATAGTLLIDAINDIYNTTFPTFSSMEVAVASSVGTGTFRRVTKVGAGRVTDTMRSRRAQLTEAHVVVSVPA